MENNPSTEPLNIEPVNVEPVIDHSNDMPIDDPKSSRKILGIGCGIVMLALIVCIVLAIVHHHHRVAQAHAAVVAAATAKTNDVTVGNQDSAKNDFADSITYYNQAIAADPSNVNAPSNVNIYGEIALNYFAEKQSAQAITAANAAIALATKSGMPASTVLDNIYYIRGVAELSLGNKAGCTDIATYENSATIKKLFEANVPNFDANTAKFCK